MKKCFTPLAVLQAFICFGQTIEPITVTTQSLTIPGVMTVASWLNNNENQKYPDYPKLFYGFSEGDEIAIDFVTENKKGAQQIEISEYESQSIVYSNKEFQTLDGIKIKVPKTAVYKFEFATNHMFDRSCKVIIKRIPVSENTKIFNCNVIWKTVNDTTFITEEQKIKIKSSFETSSLQTPIDYYINSGSNAYFKGGKSRITFPVTLPPNTVEWYYTFGATRNDNDVQATKANMELFADLSKVIDQTGTLSFGLNAISQPPGANYCDVYLLMPDQLQAFQIKDDANWGYIGEGSRENIMHGTVKIKNCCNDGTFYIGLKNPDAEYGVHVMIEIVAIIETSTYEIHQVKRPMTISTKTIPVFGY